jgi:hypothetical protein
MIKEKINELLKSRTFSNDGIFGDFLASPHMSKRYSIMKGDEPYPVGNNIYKRSFCFFFYCKGYMVETFYCEIVGNGVDLNNERINFYQYPCNDVNRADCWEWVDVA